MKARAHLIGQATQTSLRTSAAIHAEATALAQADAGRRPRVGHDRQRQHRRADPARPRRLGIGGIPMIELLVVVIVALGLRPRANPGRAGSPAAPAVRAVVWLVVAASALAANRGTPGGRASDLAADRRCAAGGPPGDAGRGGEGGGGRGVACSRDDLDAMPRVTAAAARQAQPAAEDARGAGKEPTPLNLGWLYTLYAWAIGFLVAVCVALGVIAALGQYVPGARRHPDSPHHPAAGVVVHALVKFLPLAISAVVNSTVDADNDSEPYSLYVSVVTDNEKRSEI